MTDDAVDPSIERPPGAGDSGKPTTREATSSSEREQRGAPQGWQPMNDAAEMLWVVLANVSGGDWSKQSPEWQEAAARWRDNYFAVLKAQQPLPDPPLRSGTEDGV